jgi:YegS/Rv2252/BmrU family lipid kinase
VTKRALLVRNPTSRRAPTLERLREAAAHIEGWEITIESTAAPAHATELARAAASQGYDAVVACGGDGTVNEVANGLARSATALAVVRGGTANVWAKEIHVPKDPRKALRLLADGEVRTIDLGRAGERYFLLMAGVGFDAAIVREMSGGTKRRFGAAAYVLHGLRKAIGYRSVTAEVEADGHSLSGPLYWMVLGNSRSYGGVFNLTNLAKIDDGRLHMYLLRRGGLLRLVWLLPFVLLGKHHKRPLVVHQEIEALDVRSGGLPVQIDGEYLGETPLHFGVAAGALRVMVPRGLKSPLFSHDTG